MPSISTCANTFIVSLKLLLTIIIYSTMFIIYSTLFALIFSVLHLFATVESLFEICQVVSEVPFHSSNHKGLALWELTASAYTCLHICLAEIMTHLIIIVIKMTKQYFEETVTPGSQK